MHHVAHVHLIRAPMAASEHSSARGPESLALRDEHVLALGSARFSREIAISDREIAGDFFVQKTGSAPDFEKRFFRLRLDI